MRELRSEKGMTLRAVEAATDVHAPHISEIERGVRTPTPWELAALSRFYGVDPDGWRLMMVHVS